MHIELSVCFCLHSLPHYVISVIVQWLQTAVGFFGELNCIESWVGWLCFSFLESGFLLNENRDFILFPSDAFSL